MLDQRLNYLHENPVEAGFVDEASKYLYSSAIDYSGGKGLINIYRKAHLAIICKFYLFFTFIYAIDHSY